MLMTFDTKQECAAYIRQARLCAFPHVSNALATMDKWIVVIPRDEIDGVMLDEHCFHARTLHTVWALLEDGEHMELLDW